MKTQAKITKKPAPGGKAKPGSAGPQSQAKSAQKLGNAQMGAADKSTNLNSGTTTDGETKISKEAAAHPKSTICLTFDDGPASRVTESVIAVLASEGVPATFFLNAMQGGKADADSEQQQHAFREIVANPLFQAGSHGYSHEVAGRVEYTERYAGIDPYKKDKKGKYVLDGKGRRIVDRSKIPKDDKLTFANDAKRDEFKKFLDDNSVHFRKVAENAANLKDTTDAQGAALKEWQGFKLVRLPGDGRFLINLKNEANKSNLQHVGWQFEIASGSLMRKRPGAKLDWLVKGVDAEPDLSHSKTVKGDVLPDSGVVVLLHDRHWKDTTRLRNIIQTLKKKGFAFGALDEAGSCIEVDSKLSSKGKSVEPAQEPSSASKSVGSAANPSSTRTLPSLEVGHINDPAEREAEAVADGVMRMQAGACCSACAAGGPCASHAPHIEHGQATPLRRTVAGVGNSAGLPVPVGLEPQVRRATSGGEALPATVRAFFEQRLGEDLSDVRIHRDADAAESARALGAKAYTLGSHIAFSAGRWAPGTDAGDRLIAHELAHATADDDGPIKRVIDIDDGTCLRGVMSPMAVGREAHEKIQAAAQEKQQIKKSALEGSNGKPVAMPRADLFGLWNEDQARQKGLPATRTPGNDTQWVIAEIGEIKPVSYRKGGVRHGIATAQIESYKKQWEKFSNIPSVPMKSMDPVSLPVFQSTTLTCALDADPDVQGLYIYQCSKPGEPERVAEPATLPIVVPKQVERELRDFHDIGKLPGMIPVQVRKRLASDAPALLSLVQELVIKVGIAVATAAVIALIASLIPAVAATAVAAVLIAAASVNVSPKGA
ncbi:DUF4157 domain-containing protein [Mesorhizobium sp. M0698]|uniref:eCIS core domain-containing protein n=1 Tax=Mesorhizobium sp. M0698 TaxID=2956987 RepID=UPI00333A905A